MNNCRKRERESEREREKRNSMNFAVTSCSVSASLFRSMQSITHKVQVTAKDRLIVRENEGQNEMNDRRDKKIEKVLERKVQATSQQCALYKISCWCCKEIVLKLTLGRSSSLLSSLQPFTIWVICICIQMKVFCFRSVVVTLLVLTSIHCPLVCPVKHSRNRHGFKARRTNTRNAVYTD